MRVVFKLDRQGRGIETSYRFTLELDDPEFVPGVNDVIRLRTPLEDGRRAHRVVWKRIYEIDESGEELVTIYADEVMSLLRRNSMERKEEHARAGLWR